VSDRIEVQKRLAVQVGGGRGYSAVKHASSRRPYLGRLREALAGVDCRVPDNAVCDFTYEGDLTLSWTTYE
jgi:hypothetical protein